MGADFVVDRLTPILLFIWFCGFVILLVVCLWHWQMFYDLYRRRQAATDERSQRSIPNDALLWEVQADPEVERLRRKAERRLWYAAIWLIGLLPLSLAVVALALASGPSH
jgi:hypothetical protein